MIVFGMMVLKRFLMSLAVFGIAALLAACDPEVGSDRWCEKMVDTPKGDWSANDAKAFAQHCIFKEYGDEDEEEEEERN
jgi:hypothetical protein